MSAPPPAQRKTLVVFDFDGTLTRHDSFVPFLRFAFGNTVFFRRLRQLALPTLKFLLRQHSRDALKAELIRVFLSGTSITWFKREAEDYCASHWDKLMRPKALQAVAAQLESGATVTLCSASPELLLAPFAKRLGVSLIGTQLEENHRVRLPRGGLLTGRVSGSNCRCAAKIARLEAVYGSLEQYHLRAYGDSRGDRELLAAAQEAHWKPFHWWRFK